MGAASRKRRPKPGARLNQPEPRPNCPESHEMVLKLVPFVRQTEAPRHTICLRAENAVDCGHVSVAFKASGAIRVAYGRWRQEDPTSLS